MSVAEGWPSIVSAGFRSVQGNSHPIAPVNAAVSAAAWPAADAGGLTADFHAPEAKPPWPKPLLGGAPMACASLDRTPRYSMFALLQLVFFGAAVSAASLIVPAALPAHKAATGGNPLTAFRERIADYATLKSNVAASLPDRRHVKSYEAYVDGLSRLRLALQHARADARRGSIFVPGVEPLLRQLIAESLRDHAISPADLRADMRVDWPRHAPPVRLNEPFPLARGVMMPACLLEALPLLPRDIQYRLDDRNLILIDVEINLVLDILPDALPER
jgi:hypothetical protein